MPLIELLLAKKVHTFHNVVKNCGFVDKAEDKLACAVESARVGPLTVFPLGGKPA